MCGFDALFDYTYKFGGRRSSIDFFYNWKKFILNGIRVGCWPSDDANTDRVKNLQIIVINHTWPINYHIVVFLQKIIVFPWSSLSLFELARALMEEL